MKKENLKVVIDGDFPAQKALKKFKRMCDTFGILKEYKKRKNYMKPSEQRKLKLEASEKRRKKLDRKFSAGHTRKI